jgi:tripartite ATP-independent transporter DctP family solute receptor
MMDKKGTRLMALIKRRDAVRGGFGLTAGLLAAPFVVRRAARAEPEQTLKLTYADVATSPLRPVLDRFAIKVGQLTNGAVEVRVFPQGELGSQMNILTGLQTGIIDFCAHASGFIQTIYPDVAVLDFPYLFPTTDVAEKVLDGPVGAELFKKMPAKGIYGLAWGHWGWRNTSTNERHLAEPADMKGMKIRVQPGAIYGATFKALGAIPVVVDASELYVALSQHTVDAIENPLPTVVASKWYEVLKVVNLTSHTYNAGALMASKRKLDQLKPEYQEAIKSASTELAADWRRTMAHQTDDAIQFLKEHGLAIQQVNIPAYKAAVQPVWEQFRTSIGPEFVDFVFKQLAAA